MIREILVNNMYQLPEEIGDGCLEDKAPRILDKEKKVPRLRWGLCHVKVPSQSSNRTEELFIVI